MRASTLADSYAAAEVAAIRALAREDAARGHAVELTGVVTFAYARPSSGFVLQDGSAGIYVEYADPFTGPPPAAGTKVRVRGQTGPGRYAPVVIAREMESQGRVPLPAPARVSLGEMLSGRLDCQYVEVEGVVQHVEARRGTHQLRLELATEGGLIPVYFPDTSGFDFAPLVDAAILLRGVCLPFFNERGQLAGIRIGAAGQESVTVQRAAAHSAFEAPTATLDRLLPFSPEGQSLHRRRVSGTATFVEAGRFIYLQDGPHALRVDAADSGAIRIGDRVEASGFLRIAGFQARMERAQVRPAGIGSPPPAVPANRNVILALGEPDTGQSKPDFDGRLVSVAGRLVRIELAEAGIARLFIDDDGFVITATLRNARAAASKDIRNLRNGSLVRLAGVCVVEYSQAWPAQDFTQRSGFSLLMRDVHDVEILKPAPWWTAERLLLALAGVGGLLLLASAWAFILRRQVAVRSAQLAAAMRTRREGEIEFDATLRERERLARDLHDTLEQSLAGVSFQLEASESFRAIQTAKSDHHLRIAQQLLSRSQEDLRRSVWNLHAEALKGRTLGDALNHIACEARAGRELRITTHEDGSPRSIPDFTAAQLLLIAQESIANALKHASPRQLRLLLSYAPDFIDLTIEDDGCGFDPATAPGPRDGHFGLQGMAERAKRLGGRFRIESQPGAGTRTFVRVPADSR